VEVKIGVQYAQRELVVETDETTEAVEKLVSEAISSGGLLILTDHKGKKVFVAADKITYVEVGRSTVTAVGFRS